jgi:hypothetical protein
MNTNETCRPRQVSSYIADDGSVSIMFLPCGMISFEPGHVRDRYCARCNRFIVKNFLELNHPDGRAARGDRRQQDRLF